MNLEVYKNRLQNLLETNYELIKNAKQRKRSDLKVEGFMEAGLCLGVVTKSELQDVVDAAHIKVFGVPFNEKIRPKNIDDGLLDIPTWIRDKVQITD